MFIVSIGCLILPSGPERASRRRELSIALSPEDGKEFAKGGMLGHKSF